MPTADWYFDYVSPFAYLQSEQLARLPQGLRIRYRPVLFAGLLKHWSHKGPAEIEPKREFTYRFVLWQAQKLGVPLRFPPAHPFNPLALLRLTLAADCEPRIVHAIFRFVWRDGRLPDTPLEWYELVSALGMPEADALVSASRVKDELRSNTDEAIARGVFGVPTFVVDGRVFWGLDATDMLIDYLAGAPFFSSPEYERAGALPVGVTR